LGIYWNLASEDGVFSDMNFQTDQTGSFPSHLYAIGAQSGGYYDPNHYAIDSGSGSCGAEKTVDTINMTLPYPGKAGAQTVSCSDFQTVLDLAAKKSLTWRYYSNVKAGFFSAPQAIQHLYNSPNFITPSSRFLNDVAGGTLANITYVIPTSYEDSDHPGTVVHAEDGPNWVASVVNAIGETPFWNTTTIVIWWDDWGGFFDHVAPPRPDGEPTWMGKPDPFEYSFRVPMIIVSPFAKVGTIDHTTRSFVSAIKFAEKVFALGGLGAEDKYEPGLDNALNFKLKPRPYVPVGGSAALPFAHLNDPPAQDKAIPPGVEQAEGG
jgi:phospholipase C